jgi:hypothetical protein
MIHWHNPDRPLAVRLTEALKRSAVALRPRWRSTKPATNCRGLGEPIAPTGVPR